MPRSGSAVSPMVRKKPINKRSLKLSSDFASSDAFSVFLAAKTSYYVLVLGLRLNEEPLAFKLAFQNLKTSFGALNIITLFENNGFYVQHFER